MRGQESSQNDRHRRQTRCVIAYKIPVVIAGDYNMSNGPLGLGTLLGCYYYVSRKQDERV